MKLYVMQGTRQSIKNIQWKYNRVKLKKT